MITGVNCLPLLQLSEYLKNPFFYIEYITKFAAFVFLFVVSLKVRKKYLENQTKFAQSLYRALLCFAFAALVQSFDGFFIDDITLKLVGYQIEFGQIGAYTFAAIGNYNLLLVSQDIAGKIHPTRAIVVMIANLIVIGIFASLAIINDSYIIIFVIVIHVIISYAIFGLLSKRAFSTAKAH